MSRRATVVGVGLIGGSIGLALRERGWHISGVDTDNDCLNRALELGTIDSIGWDAEAEIIFVATPVSTVASLVKEALVSSPSAVVTDAGSVKNPIVQEIRDQRF
ncbi:MAG TPA: prephenate dehydrogenase/arogenate dehydrogenase family protein, partial [Acidimicrobiales bacterium]|nr:prephenate dehydrogenase/arogenate dehydrogenase family protein [Acidimicrobiales bacterium]